MLNTNPRKNGASNHLLLKMVDSRLFSIVSSTIADAPFLPEEVFWVFGRPAINFSLYRFLNLSKDNRIRVRVGPEISNKKSHPLGVTGQRPEDNL